MWKHPSFSAKRLYRYLCKCPIFTGVELFNGQHCVFRELRCMFSSTFTILANTQSCSTFFSYTEDKIPNGRISNASKSLDINERAHYAVAVRTYATKTVQNKHNNDLSRFQLHFIISFVVSEPKLAH